METRIYYTKGFMTNAQEDTVDDRDIKLFLSVVVMFWGRDLTGGISKSL